MNVNAMLSQIDMAGDVESYANHTTLHPLGLTATVVLGIALLRIPRPWSLLPFILMACFVSSAQRIVVFGADFNLVRILLIFGFVRVLFRQEYCGVAWRGIDAVMVLYAVVKMVAYTSLYGTPQAFVYSLGQIYDSVGLFFLFRCLVRDWSDLYRLAVCFTIVSFPVCLAFIVERLTGRNVFAVFGGVLAVTDVRDGRLRCQGAFSHPILAGCFWAAVLPMIAALLWRPGAARVAIGLGLVAALSIVVLCASSTPILGVLAAGVATAFFPLRHRLGWVRWGVVVSLAGLHFIMKKPVWHLISRIDVVGGSTGWHRYHLVDNAIRHFDEWAALGTMSTEHWGYGLEDVTNQYVLEGVRGGFLTLALFVLIMALAFRDVGRLCRSCSAHRAALVMGWALGVCLFVHAMCFIAVSYFGQITLLWYLALAIPVSLSDSLYARRPQTDFALSAQQQSLQRPRWDA